LVEEIGMKWSLIAKQMKGRTDVQLKYRYKRIKKKKDSLMLQQTKLQYAQPSQLESERIYHNPIKNQATDNFLKQNESIFVFQTSDNEIYNQTEQEKEMLPEDLETGTNNFSDQEEFSFADFVCFETFVM
jgi:hypothetical protein